MTRPRSPTRTLQRGAATLVVVMVLFFVMSLVAAYASRNIIFEQRTATNYFTSTSSTEAAEAGLQWALSMLNGPRINENCGASTNASDTSFRQRYLSTDANTGTITVAAAVRDGPQQPSCWYDRVNNAWVCHCPSSSAGSIASLPTDTYAPSFKVRFIQQNNPSAPTRASIVRIEVMGCTRYDSGCLTFAAAASTCGGTVCAHLGLVSGAKSPPAAAITARGAINVGGASLGAYNTGAGSSGLTVLAGGTVASAGMDLRGPTGMPASQTVVQNDPGLSSGSFNANRMFAAVFGMWPDSHIEQPAVVRVPCATACSATDVRNAIVFNPDRPLVFEGDVALDGGASIGSATAPVALVVTGNLTFTAPTDVYGLVYVRAANWATAGTGQVFGAVVAEGQISGSGAFKVIYDNTVLQNLRWTSGSLAMVPGSWKDFR